MSIQIAPALIVFALSMSLTPGAGNISLFGIANRYGFVAALPFVAGTVFSVMVVFVGSSAGMVNVFERYPDLYIALKYIGAGYLLYLAWGIANISIKDDQTSKASLGFWSGTCVQILNPKAWIAAMTAISQFVDLSSDYQTQVLTITLVFLLAVFCSNLTWVYFGTLLKSRLSSTNQMQVINRSLGATLACTVVFMVSQPL